MCEESEVKGGGCARCAPVGLHEWKETSRGSASKSSLPNPLCKVLAGLRCKYAAPRMTCATSRCGASNATRRQCVSSWATTLRWSATHAPIRRSLRPHSAETRLARRGQSETMCRASSEYMLDAYRSSRSVVDVAAWIAAPSCCGRRVERRREIKEDSTVGRPCRHPCRPVCSRGPPGARPTG